MTALHSVLVGVSDYVLLCSMIGVRMKGGFHPGGFLP